MSERPDEASGPAEVAPKRAASLSRPQVVLAAIAVVLAGATGVKLGYWLRGLRHGDRDAHASPPPLPEAEPIWTAWRAAKEGDVAAYLACFAPPERTKLEAEIERDGAEAVGRRLKADASAALGLMIEPLDEAPEGQQGFRAAVGRKEEVELYDYLVVPDGERWKISTVVPRGRRPGPLPAPEVPEPPAQPGDPK